MSKDFQLKDLDPQLHREFKAACSHFGLSMKQVLVKHMQNIVNDYWKAKMQLDYPKYNKRRLNKK
jgi:hypothetical protein